MIFMVAWTEVLVELLAGLFLLPRGADRMPLFRIGGGISAPTSALPIGEESAVDKLALTPAM